MASLPSAYCPMQTRVLTSPSSIPRLGATLMPSRAGGGGVTCTDALAVRVS